MLTRIGTAPLRLAGWLDGAGRPGLASLHDDHTASAARYVVERHPDLIGEFLADDEQPPRGLPKQLVEAALGQYVAMEPPPRLFARLPDHFEQVVVGLPHHVARYQQRAKFALVTARDTNGERERRAPVRSRVDGGKDAFDRLIRSLNENANVDRERRGSGQHVAHHAAHRVAAGGGAMIAEQDPADLRGLAGGDDFERGIIRPYRPRLDCEVARPGIFDCR